jgi:site-specific DNA recombinase
MQAMQEGDLSERAKRRAKELAQDAEIRLYAPRPTVAARSTPARAARRGSSRSSTRSTPSARAAEAYIASQKERGMGLPPEKYDDGGFTGGNMERPALKRLMADIEAGKVDCVVVYKVDRSAGR